LITRNFKGCFSTFHPHETKVGQNEVSHSTIWYHWGEFLLKYRKSILIASLALIAVLAWPISSLKLGLPTDEVAAKDTSQRQAYDLLSKGFGPGYNGPLLVLVEGLAPTSDSDRAAVRQQLLQQYQLQLQSQDPAATQAAMTPQAQAAAEAKLNAAVDEYAKYYQLQQVADKVAKLNNVERAQAALVTDSGEKGVIQVTPKSGPSDQATIDLVAELRNEDTQKELTNNTDISLGVTGTTAIQIDIDAKLGAALPVYLLVVVGLSLVILMLAFRSILIPIKATLGFLLSVLAMFGALVAVFQFGWLGITDAPGPIVSFVPIIAIGILFGLAMDYEFFLVSGMQEAHHRTKNAKVAVVEGFALGSRVVVAAGLIMVAVFAGFISSHDSTIQSIGFALAVGILVDAFIVRMTIVPIIMSYLGESAWWIPKWLDKRLPKVSIEGKQ
jgi:RND superfamily putative drug exporter